MTRELVWIRIPGTGTWKRNLWISRLAMALGQRGSSVVIVPVA